jgi:pimeloyl-ACP methyl ester carboxylesterase
VYDILVKDGYKVSIVQEPETSFTDDVGATKRVLAQQDGPCILVGHSYGGAVITEAGTDSSVAGLVYVAAHMPDSGENEADDGKRFPSDLSKSGALKKTAANRAGRWWQREIERLTPTLNAGMPHEPTAIRSKWPEPVTPSTFPDQKRLQL